MEKIKKYFLVALASLVLLVIIFLFNHKDFSGRTVYSIPEDKIAFNIIENNIPNYFCKDKDNKFHGVFKFKVREGSWLPADLAYVGLIIYNKLPDGTRGYSDSNFDNKLRDFMGNTTPLMEDPVLFTWEISIAGIAGGVLSSGGEADIYNSTDPNVLANSYSVDVGMYDLDLPAVGSYIYAINATAGLEEGGADIDGEHVQVLNGEFSVFNSPPTLIKNIPNQSFSGGFKKDFMQLSEYFSDKDGDVLSYSKLGGNKINLSINKDSSVNITAPLNYSLDEGFSILASDGINSTSSNLFFIKIINVSIGANLTNVSCIPNWSIGDWGDCDPTGIRVRSVIDLNNCNISIGKPVGSESCTYTGAEVLTPPPIITQPGIIQKKESIFKNKFVLSGIILGLFLLLLIIILVIDRLRKRKGKFREYKEKVKVEAAPREVYKPKIEGVAPVKHVEEELSAVNFNEIVKYVKDMLGKGGKIEAVKEKLIASGWKKEQVEEAINFVRVKEFVEGMLSKGESKEKIIKLLKEKGWKEEFINRILKE